MPVLCAHSFSACSRCCCGLQKPGSIPLCCGAADLGKDVCLCLQTMAGLDVVSMF
jgi:hypothetical protein